MSTVSAYIPESIRQKWREYWKSVKKTESDTLGNGDVSETVEMMGWGVEKAQEHHDEAASKHSRTCSPALPFRPARQMRPDGTFVFRHVLYAETVTNSNAIVGLGTQLALAYAIHKSFIFLRVPLTAAVTPKVVKKLRSWGWNIGKKA